MKFHVFGAALILSSAFLISCNQGEESDNLALAQQCLDQVPTNDPGAASSCLQYVEKYTSQQANILKCSIYMTSGGLIESKIVKAYQALKDSSIPEANRTAAYMSILSLDVPDASGGYTKALNADTYCQATGVPGLKFISGVVVSGSWLAKTMTALAGSAIDFTDTTAVNNAVNNMLNTNGGCADPDAADVPPECAQNLADLGNAVANLSVSYCSNEKADASVCDKINAAKEAAGNNATNVGQALICYLKNKTFNEATGLCNP